MMDVKKILKSLKYEDVRDDSYDVFHTKGITYINLVRTPHYTAKLYYMQPWDMECTAEDMIVNPHTHNYAFKTTVLGGHVENILFNMIPNPSGDWDFCSWHSHLNGGKGAKKLSKCDLDVASKTVYSKGESYYCTPKEIHSLSCDVGTVLFLEQYEDENDTNHYFSNDSESDSCYYSKFKDEESFNGYLDEIRKMINS